MAPELAAKVTEISSPVAAGVNSFPAPSARLVPEPPSVFVESNTLAFVVAPPLNSSTLILLVRTFELNVAVIEVAPLVV